MSNQAESSGGKLYIVSTPIGNKDDISVRATNTIKRCDILVCEEMKMGALTLKNLNFAKEMLPLNENNETQMTMEVLNYLREGKKIALISDAGTPVFADPGLYLVKSAISNNIDIEVVPGASSIMTAIVRSGFELYEFLYAGFLPRKNEDRDRKIQKLARERRTVVIFETPYRLNTLMQALANIMPERRAYIGMNLTMPFETHHYGTLKELAAKFENSNLKAEFVLVIEANKDWIDNKHHVDTDEEDDSPETEFEYPVKAHAKPKPVNDSRRGFGAGKKERKVIQPRGGDGFKKHSFSDNEEDGLDKRFRRKSESDRGERSFNRDKSSSFEKRGSGRDRKSFGEKPIFKKRKDNDSEFGGFRDNEFKDRRNDKSDSFDNRPKRNYASKSSGKFKGKSNGKKGTNPRNKR